MEAQKRNVDFNENVPSCVPGNKSSDVESVLIQAALN